jgi:glutamyl-tRNA synthetase
MAVRVRFAPSPTGHLHVGGARTALFNWLYARKSGGVFVLRIEDTDRQRSDPAMTEEILAALSWMGLEWDEGPFFQSERIDRYREAALRLLRERHAYYCFCDPEMLAGKREEAARKKIDWRYDRACIDIDPVVAAERVERGEAAALRFRIDADTVRFTDTVFGEIRKEGRELEDFVLVRSGGQPTYQLGVVVDDIDMRMTHIVRGADHIANTPKQLLLYQALGAEPPEFAHVPLILGPDKSRLSKRHGATAVGAYREQGVLPEAFDNFLALLGWSDGTDREVFDRESLIDAFSLRGISKANAVFDADKLTWFNGQFIQALDPAELMVRIRPFLEAEGLWDERLAAGDRDWFLGMLEMIRPRFRSLRDLARATAVYTGESVTLDADAAERFLSDPNLGEYLPLLASRLEAVEAFDLDSSERVVRELAGELGVKAGLLINACRAALTGQRVGPGIFDIMVTLGRERTVRRIRDAVGSLRL